jgi:hypothetical protein
MQFEETTMDNAVVEAPVVNEAPIEEKPIEQPVDEKPAEEKPIDEPKQEDNSVIRNMRKILKQQQKEIAMLKEKVVIPEETIPSREQFETDAEYIKAEVEHQIAKRTAAVGPDIFQKKFEEVKQAHPDMDEVLDNVSHVNFSNGSIDALRQAVEILPYGGDVYYHIAKNPDLAEELSILPPAIFAAKIGELHSEIKQAKTKKVQVSKAPAPINPVSPVSKNDRDYDNMDQNEYERIRRKERQAYKLSKYGI